MEQSFYFYDLETSGFNPREDRIMQFAGQRTDMNLKPIGEPHNVLVRMTDEVLPSPEAILVTGITPQKTIDEGLTEAEFCRLFMDEISRPGTVFLGYNTVRFDDEFMRYTLYRNYYDPYEWQWSDGRSRWDLLDVVRLTRALRPEGINWPVRDDGIATNRLELLTSLNGIAHEQAHDALNDVSAVISIAGLIKATQPKLMDYMFKLRDKNEVARLVESGEPLLYTSGKYPAETLHTSVVVKLCDHPQKKGALVYDLRFDPDEFINMSSDELRAAWQRKRDEGNRLPVKTLQYNRCPAVAPLSALNPPSQDRIKLATETVQAHLQKLRTAQDTFTNALLQALGDMDREREARYGQETVDAEAALYSDFVPNQDKTMMSVVRSATEDELQTLEPSFKDKRLNDMLPRYKARNFARSLSDDERQAWESYRSERLMGGGEASRMHNYFNALSALAAQPDITEEKMYLLEELQLYGQSIMPYVD